MVPEWFGESLKAAERDPEPPVVGRGQQKTTPRHEHPDHLRQPRGRIRDVLEHLARPDEIKRVVLQGQPTLDRNQTEVEIGMSRPGARKCRLRDVGPDRIGAGLGHQSRELAGPAAEVKDPVAWLEIPEKKPAAQLPFRRIQFGRQPPPEFLVVVPHPRSGGGPLVVTRLRQDPVLAHRQRSRQGDWSRAPQPPSTPTLTRQCSHAVQTPRCGCRPTLRLSSENAKIASVRVAFDSRPARQAHGVGRYSGCLLDALRARPHGEITETHRPRRCDVFHAPWLDGALLRSPVPMVVTLHDLVPLKRRGEYLRSSLRFKLRYLAVQRASRVIVPTNAVAEEAVEALGIPRERIAVIPEAAAPELHRLPESEVAAVRERYGLPKEYLLWVGRLTTPDPRKRVAALVRTPRRMPLVLVGAAGSWARELPDVTLTGALADHELAAIYSGAHALVFPSDDEGFGLPPVEALACGTPVVACDLPALREVLEGRAILRSVDDLDGLVAAAEAASRPAPPPPAWTWEDAAAATWEVYAQAADSELACRNPVLTGAVLTVPGSRRAA